MAFGRAPVLLAASTNQDGSLIALGSEQGFAVVATAHGDELQRRDVGGVQHVALSFCSNIVALVGGGRDPADAKNKVLIWDDQLRQIVYQIEFKTHVLGIGFRKERLFVALIDRIFVYRTTTPFSLAHVQTIESHDNPFGLFDVCPHSLHPMLAMPGRQRGHVHIVDLRQDDHLTSVMVAAHQHSLAALALSRAGDYVATASEQGTLIRIFNVATREMRFELRRGYTSAKVMALAFNSDASMLAASTDFSLHFFVLSSPTHASHPTAAAATTAAAAAAATAAAAAATTAAPSAPVGTPPHFSVTFDLPMKLVCFWTRVAGDGERLMAVRGDLTWREYTPPTDGSAALVLTKFGRLLKPDPAALFRVKDAPTV